MIVVVGKSGNISPYVKAISQAVANPFKPLTPAVAIAPNPPVVPSTPLFHHNYTLRKFLPTNDIKVKCGPGVTTQVRYAHTDLTIPDFSAYRRPSTQDANIRTRDNEESRKSFTYLVVAGGTVGTIYAAKTVVTQFVTSMSATADVLALAKIEVKLGDIPEGKSFTFKWRGKPLFIRHRTSEEIEKEKKVNISELRDPQRDEDRAQKPEWLILIGVCTHLGCVPIADAGDYGGYYCPCHGSHYDGSGRIRKGPAPLNLEIPYYEFLDESTVIVG